jgi:hypothetical protein
LPLACIAPFADRDFAGKTPWDLQINFLYSGTLFLRISAGFLSQIRQGRAALLFRSIPEINF